MAMIERISGGVMVLRPTAGVDRGPRRVGVRIETDVDKPAEYLYNPDLAEKINVSRESIREEMSLLREASFAARLRQREDRPVDEEERASLSLDVLKRSLARIKTLLYQVASVAGADPDSLEALQRKLAEELRGYERVFEQIDLKGVESPDLGRDRIAIGGKIDAGSVDSESFEDTMEVISSAEKVVERMLERTQGERSRQSRTEAILSTTDQNLAAAESAFYPQEIMSRAKEASFSLRDRMPEAFTAQAHLRPDQVYGLTSPGQ